MQVLEFVDCQLFNQLLLRPECCSVGNARYALRGLKQLDTWIIAEQSAAHHEPNRGSGRHAAAVAGTGSIHSGSFNSQAAPGAAGAEGSSACKGGGGGSTAAAQPSSPAARGAAGGDSASSTGAVAAPAEEDDGGWEQVPADTGEFDAWQPPKQQQQQHWWRPHKQQQAAAGGPEQPELGPEAWNALSHVRQVGWQLAWLPSVFRLRVSSVWLVFGLFADSDLGTWTHV